MAHGEYMTKVKNPLFFWWLYGPQIPTKIISIFAIMLKPFIRDYFSLLVLLTKINFLIQTIVAAFSMLLLTRELFGKNNVLNITSAVSYSLASYYLSETVLFSARTWAFSLAPLALWITYKYYRITSQNILLREKARYALVGGIIFSISFLNPLDSIITVGIPTILLCLAIFIYILIIETDTCKALRYLAYVASGLAVSLMLSLYFLPPYLYSYIIDWPLKKVHGISGYEENFVRRYIPSFMEALQAINMEHKYHFTHIWPFRYIIKYPSLTYSLIPVFLLGFSLVLSSKIKFRHREDEVTIFVFYTIVLVGLIMVCMSANIDLYEIIRSVIPYGVYLKKPHRLLIFWNIVISLSPAFIGYIIAKHQIRRTKTSGNSNYKVLKTAFLLAITCIYISGALTWAYSTPFSVLANYEPIYSSYIKSWRQDVVKYIWNCLNMSNPLHRDLTVTYVSGIHTFSYNYPGFTLSRTTFLWTKYYEYSPSYKDILSLYGIKYIIARKGSSRSLPLYDEYNDIEIKQVPHEVKRVYMGYPLLVTGGPNALLDIPILMKDVVQEVLHLPMNDTPTLVPIFADSLSLEQFNYTISKINSIVLHNADLLDLIALQGMYHHWSVPIVDIREPQKVEKVIDEGWKFFEPKYYKYLAPSGMQDSVYGQVTYGDYALYSTNISKPLKRSLDVKFDGTCTLMLRLGRFSVGNTSELNIIIERNNETIWNSTIQILWLGFRWITVDLGNISRNNYNIVLTPHGRLYIDNVIIVLPKTCFNEYHEWASRLIRSKHIIYIYEPSSYTENLTGYASLLPVKYSASDPSLGVLLLYNTSEIKMKSHIAEGNYLLFIRYKSTNPQAINVTVTISNKEVLLTEIARSIDDYGWFYILYFLRVNSTDSNNVLTLKIRSICNSVYIDFSSLISMYALRNIYSIPISSSIKTNLEVLRVGRIKWNYVLKYNKAIAGEITCFKSPCIVVFVWPMRLPSEWIMKVEEETIIPVKALYMLHGYILAHKGVQNFELYYNPPTLILFTRAISITMWLIVLIYLLLIIPIARLIHRLDKN